MALKIDAKFEKEGQDYFKFDQKRHFFIPYDNQVLLGVISKCGPPYCTLYFQNCHEVAYPQGQEQEDEHFYYS